MKCVNSSESNFAGVNLEQPFVARLAAENFQAPGFNVDERIFLQRGNLPISAELRAAATGSGGVGEDLDNQLRVLDRQIGTAVTFVTGHHHVRVEKSVGAGHAQFHVGDERQARGAMHVFAQGGKNIQCSGGVNALHRLLKAWLGGRC